VIWHVSVALRSLLRAKRLGGASEATTGKIDNLICRNID
jgi:hypothetical protein